MLLTFLIISTQSRDLFTKINAGASEKCTASSPCSYEKAQQEMQKGDYLFFDDKYIENPTDIEKVRVIMNDALNNGVIIASNKMTINATYYDQTHISFIIIQTSNDVQMHNFYFTGFRNTILCIRKSNKNIIEHCTFAYNNPIRCIGLVMIGSGKTSLTECKFTENSVTNSSLISLNSAFLYMKNTTIERNFIEHESSQPLLYSINSVIEHTRTSIQENSSPYSPLYKFEYINKVGFWNCTWQNNHHKELMLCDGKCNFNFTDGIITNNHGSILTTSESPSLNIKSTKFIDNFAEQTPLFIIPAGLVYISHNTEFIGNNGFTLFETKFSNIKGEVKITNSLFHNNKFEYSLLSSGNGSSIIENCYFTQNSAQNGILNFEETKSTVTNSTFLKSAGTSIMFHNTTGYVDACLFSEGTGLLGNAVTAIGGRTSVVSSTFEGPAIGGHIVADRPRHFAGLAFSSGEEDALDPELRRECYLCRFRFAPPVRASVLTLAGPYVIAAIALVFTVAFFKDEIWAALVWFFTNDEK